MNTDSIALAAINRIKELEAALIEAAILVEGVVVTTTQHDEPFDDPDWQEAQRWRALVSR